MPRPSLPPWIHEPAGVVLGTRTKVAILRALCGTGAPLSQRELARRTRLTPRSVGVALDNLVAIGVVLRHVGGREHLLTISEAHLLAPALRTLFDADARYLGELRQAVLAVAGEATGRGLLSVAFFGSVARATELPESDLDLFLLGETRAAAEHWQERYLEAASALRTRFGVRVAPVAYGLAEARQRWARRQPPLPEVMRDATVLVGPPLREVLGR